MRSRIARAGLMGLLGLALVGALYSEAGAVPSWSFKLIPVGPLTVAAGDSIDFDMEITALTAEAVSFSPLDFGDSGFTTDLEGDVDEVSFFDVFFALVDSYTVPGLSSATFDYGTLEIDPAAPPGTEVRVIAKAVPDPIAAGLHDPPLIEVAVDVKIPPGGGGVPIPPTAILLGAGLLSWYLTARRTRRG
jgi:hypothetical protein